MKMQIEHLAYLFDWQPTIPYHDLCKYILDYPPEGYEFVENPSEPDEVRESKLNQYLATFKQNCIQAGINETDVENFVNTRNKSLNLKIPERPCWITTLPMCLTYNPWLFEIEDWATMGYPYIGNNYRNLGNLWEEPVIKILKQLFLMDNFKGVVTHVQSTIKNLLAIFGEELAHKFHYVPMGYPIPDLSKKRPKDKTLRLLFHGSFNHTTAHFDLRGGKEVVQAFIQANDLNPNIKLTIIYDKNGLCTLNREIYSAVMSHPDITYIGQRLPKEQFTEQLLNHDVLCIPAYRLHCVTTVQGLMYGMPVLCSDGWGFDDFVKHGYNGFIAKGCKMSWTDEHDIMRERYQINLISEELVENLKRHMLILVNQPEIYQAMSNIARKEASKYHSIKNRNIYLKKVFDQCFQN